VGRWEGKRDLRKISQAKETYLHKMSNKKKKRKENRLLRSNKTLGLNKLK
jgi:hypothetical protein